ncbi:MAG: cell division protein FtsZ [Flavicella sp.]
MNSEEFDNISFDMPKAQSNTIKVIGVGGGGSNAVNHMFQQQTKGVDFVICNTDAQALANSPIPNKIQLGVSLTSGLGAGANPDVGQEAAIESLEEVKNILTTNTKMVFITAGMGGGTGTGAAPIIAKLAKDLDILTVGIVTMPFQFEGRMRSKQAQKGVDELRKNVDSLIVINNNKLREVYGNLGFKAGFSKADEVLSTASRGIAEVITHHYKQNIDLHDAKTVLSNSGTAIMGSAKESGTDRAKNAIVKALDSPLLNDNKITGAKNVLLLIISGKVEVTLDEIGEINDFIQLEAGYDANIIMGVGEDEELGDAIAVTVVATGFAAHQQSEITDLETKKIIHTLEEGQKAVYNFDEKNTLQSDVVTPEVETPNNEEKIVHLLEEEEEEVPKIVNTTDYIKEVDVMFEPVDKNLDSNISDNVEEAIEKVDEFIIDEIEQIQPTESKEVPKQMDLVFDMPIERIDPESSEEETVEDEKNDEAKKVVFDLNSDNVIEEFKNDIVSNETETIDINEIIVHDHEEITNEESEFIRHTLNDFDIAPTIKNASNLNVPSKQENDKQTPEEEVDEALQFTVKKVEEPILPSTNNEKEAEISPLDATISDIKKRTDVRREKMKALNYKFQSNRSNNSASYVDDIESQPAYKRMGLDLDESKASSSSKSRITLSTDENDDLKFRSNNSFLHDNVD